MSKDDRYIWVCNLCGKIMHSELDAEMHTKHKCKNYIPKGTPSFSKEEFEKAKFVTVSESDER